MDHTNDSASSPAEPVDVMPDGDDSLIEVQGMEVEFTIPDEVAAWLRHQPIELGEVTGTGDNLLHLAAADGNVPAIEWLIGTGLDPRAVDFAGEDPLGLAIRHAHYAAANTILRYTEEERHVDETVELPPSAVQLPDDLKLDLTPDEPESGDSDTRERRKTTSAGTKKKKSGITRDAFRRDGTARQTGMFRRDAAVPNVDIVGDAAREEFAPSTDRNAAIPAQETTFRPHQDPASRLDAWLRPIRLAVGGAVLVLLIMVGNYIGTMDIPASFMTIRYPAGTVYDITPDHAFLPDPEVKIPHEMLKIASYGENVVHVELYHETPDSPIPADVETRDMTFSQLLNLHLLTARQRELFGSGYFPSILHPVYNTALLSIDAALVQFSPDVRATPQIRWVIDCVVMGILGVIVFAILLALPAAFDRNSGGTTACGRVALGITLGALPLIAAVHLGGESARALARHVPAAFQVAPALAVAAFVFLVLIALAWPVAGAASIILHLARGRVGNVLRYAVSILIAVAVVALTVNSVALAISLSLAVLLVYFLTDREEAPSSQRPGLVQNVEPGTVRTNQ